MTFAKNIVQTADKKHYNNPEAIHMTPVHQLSEVKAACS